MSADRRVPPIRLAVFDLDGTLTCSGTSVLLHLGTELGFEGRARDLVTGYANGALANEGISAEVAQLLAGRARGELQDALATLPMVDGIAETVERLQGLHVRCALATITFDFAADYVAERFGFERVAATELEWSLDGRVTGDVVVALDGEDKCVFIRRLCSELGISTDEVLMVGDMRSDIPAMRIAGWSVGFNPTPDVARLASVALHDRTDLRDILPPLEHVLRDGVD